MRECDVVVDYLCTKILISSQKRRLYCHSIFVGTSLLRSGLVTYDVALMLDCVATQQSLGLHLVVSVRIRGTCLRFTDFLETVDPN